MFSFHLEIAQLEALSFQGFQKETMRSVTFIVCVCLQHTHTINGIVAFREILVSLKKNDVFFSIRPTIHTGSFNENKEEVHNLHNLLTHSVMGFISGHISTSKYA